jgi:hypothetical protein
MSYTRYINCSMNVRNQLLLINRTGGSSLVLDRLGSVFKINEDCALVVDFEYFFQIVLYTIIVFFVDLKENHMY